MTEPVASWSEIVGLMVVGRGPLPTLTGVVRVVSVDWDDDDDGRGPGEPVETVHRVYVSGSRVRRESLEGVVWAIDGEDEQWIWDDPDEPPVCDPYSSSAFGEDAPITREQTFEWDDDEDERPVEPILSTEYLGRRAWDVRWRHQRHRRLVVDDETGLVLHRSGDGGEVEVAEWLELTTGASLDDGLFEWDGPGPVRGGGDATLLDARAERDARARAHLLTAVVRALDRWDEVAAFAAEAETEGDLLTRLGEMLDIDPVGAQAVADLQLRRATGASRERIEDDLAGARSSLYWNGRSRERWQLGPYDSMWRRARCRFCNEADVMALVATGDLQAASGFFLCGVCFAAARASDVETLARRVDDARPSGHRRTSRDPAPILEAMERGSYELRAHPDGATDR
ncbi:hypothetical protein [Mumia sp. Pv 4-285]|uniref:hypothetical protein n=1 Tax=Mumia qirimensis TaxID=3234852 RepID=UPI00351D5B56